MANPFRKFVAIGKVAYQILKKVEAAEQLGIIPPITVKGFPVDAIDSAAEQLVKALKDARTPKGA